MGFLQQNAGDVGFTAAQGVVPNSADALSTLGAAASNAISTFGRIKQEKEASKADAELSAMKDEAAIDSVSVESTVEREKAQADVEIAEARASSDPSKLAKVLSQVEDRRKRTILAHNTALTKRLEFYRQKGLAAEYLAAYNGFTGKKTTELDQVADATSKFQQQQEEILKANQASLRDAGYVVTGDPSTDMANMAKLQSVQKPAVDAAREVGLSKNKAVLWDANHGATTRSMMSSFIANGYRQVTQQKTPEDRQRAYEAFVESFSDFDSALQMAVQQGKIKREDYDAFIRNDSLLDGQLSTHYSKAFERYQQNALEYAKKGFISAEKDAEAKIITNANTIATSQWLESAYPRQGAVIQELISKTPTIGAEMLAALTEVQNGSATQNIKAVKQASDLITSMEKKAGGKFSDAAKASIKGMVRSINLAANNSDASVQADALSSITPELWNLIPEGPERRALVNTVNETMTNIKLTIEGELEKAGVDGKFTDYVDVTVTPGGNLVLMPRKGADLKDATLVSKLTNPSIINNAVKAYSVIYGVDLKEAVRLFENGEAKPTEKPAKEDKTSGLDLSGLDETDVMDIQSYILELKAKQQRSSTMVS